MSILPLLYKYHEFYNIFYYISSFANPVLTYRCYANGLNIEPSNTNKYVTGTLNKGQREENGEGEEKEEKKMGQGEGKGKEQGEGPRGGIGERERTGGRAKGKKRGNNKVRNRGEEKGMCFTGNCSKFSYSHI